MGWDIDDMVKSNRTTDSAELLPESQASEVRERPAYHATHEAWLLEVTGLPTAAGREQRVVAWIEQWVADRPGLTLRRDAFGNLEVLRESQAGETPIYFTAHMDHPAFVVHQVESSHRLIAEFRGGVSDSYFKDTTVLLHQDDAPVVRGVIDDFIEPPVQQDPVISGAPKFVAIDFGQPMDAQLGDVLTWDVGPPRIEGNRLWSPACDDLAGLVAALAAYDLAIEADSGDGDAPGTSDASDESGGTRDIRLLFTRAEEVGFVGAIAAAQAGVIPQGARLICLENSKTFPEAPLGAGPIVRVGDRTSTFDPALTYAASRVAEQLKSKDDHFNWQRKLMPGGTCEASAFCAWGYTATCLCLALHNYHNMDTEAGRIAAESIHLADFHDLVRLLEATAATLDDQAREGEDANLKARLTRLFEQRRGLLTPLPG